MRSPARPSFRGKLRPLKYLSHAHRRDVHQTIVVGGNRNRVVTLSWKHVDSLRENSATCLGCVKPTLFRSNRTHAIEACVVAKNGRHVRPWSVSRSAALANVAKICSTRTQRCSKAWLFKNRAAATALSSCLHAAQLTLSVN